MLSRFDRKQLGVLMNHTVLFHQRVQLIVAHRDPFSSAARSHSSVGTRRKIDVVLLFRLLLRPNSTGSIRRDTASYRHKLIELDPRRFVVCGRSGRRRVELIENAVTLSVSIVIVTFDVISSKC